MYSIASLCRSYELRIAAENKSIPSENFEILDACHCKKAPVRRKR